MRGHHPRPATVILHRFHGCEGTRSDESRNIPDFLRGRVLGARAIGGGSVPSQVALDIAVHEQAQLGSTPAWDSGSDSVLWVDIPTSTVHRYTPGGRDHTLEVPQPVSAALPRSCRGLVLHLAEGIALFDASGEQRTWLVYWAREGVRGAATAVDRKGRMWATTTCEDGSADGWLVRVAPNGLATVMRTGMPSCQGLAFSPEQDRMYLANSTAGRIEVLGFDAEAGTLASASHSIDVDGQPAGLCTDAEGYLWVTVSDRAEIRRYAPDGGLDQSIPLPAQRPFGCCFGGRDLSDLYITTARSGLAEPGEADGALLMLPGVRAGLRTYAFAG